MSDEQHWALLAAEDGMLAAGPTEDDWDTYHDHMSQEGYTPQTGTVEYDPDMEYGEVFDPDVLAEAVDRGLTPGRSRTGWQKYC